jgi:hypothetical protein
MKLIVPFFFLILFSCGAESENSDQVERPLENNNNKADRPTVESMLDNPAPNFKDGNGLRQGHWCFFGKDDPVKGYPDHGKIEEGFYEDGRKVGDWIYFTKDGEVDSTVTYED